MSVHDSAASAEIRNELYRVLASPQFADSPKLSAFLRYVVEKTLAGEAEDIKEYSIAIDVFDRLVSFDPRLDTIVRVQATKLRSRLSEYYSNTRNPSGVRIHLPRGSYVPSFDGADDVPGQAAGPIASAARLPRPQSRGRKWTWAVALAGVVGAALLIMPRFRPVHGWAAPVRFAVSPPPGTAFRWAEMSPDGRRMVAAVEEKGASTALYMHSFESESGHILPGTAGAEMLSWSGDGKSLLFAAAGKVRKMDLPSSAAASSIGDRASGFGADWSLDNVILLGSDSAGIQRLSSSGEVLQPVTALDSSHHEVAHAWPRFLPDGKRFVYLARSESPGASAICIASLDGTVRKRLLPVNSRAQFVPATNDARSGAGYLLYVSQSILLAHPFDWRKLEFTGAPRQVASNVPDLPYGASPFSASATGALVYGTDAGPMGQFTWFDRAGQTLGTLGPSGLIGDPVLSPDGRRLAFDLAEGSNRDIWTAEVATGKLSRLTFDPEVDHCPVWSPDGRTIAFESHRGSRGIYMKDAYGTGPESLLGSGTDRPSSWSPDFRWLIFDSMRPLVDVKGIWLLPLDGQRQPREWLRTAANEDRATVSPDGKWIAYSSFESGQQNVNVQRFSASSPPTGSKWQVSYDGGSQPVWRADGKELFYLSRDRQIMATAVRSGPGFRNDLPVVLFDPQVLTLHGPCVDYSTRDGKRFLVRVPVQPVPAPPLHVIMNWPAVLKP